MANYKCIRKCHYMGKKFNLGDIIAFEHVPPHHFTVVGQGVQPTVEIKKVIIDPMAPSKAKEVNTFYEMANADQEKINGFASSIKGVKPMMSMKELKPVQKPEPATEAVKRNKKK